MSYPIDNPFRPPVEFISSVAARGSIVGIAIYCTLLRWTCVQLLGEQFI
jgi:hypothetical protein